MACFIRKNTPELRKKLEELGVNYDNVFYRGELKNITDFYKTYCDRCGSQRCDRSEEWMDACPHYKEWKEM